MVDVREPFERRAGWIPGSVAAALSSFDAEALRAEHSGRQIVFHCQSGTRSADAAKRFQKATREAAVYRLAGGFEAWQRAGRPVERDACAPRLGVMRQVQLAAGGTALGVGVHPGFLALPAFVGCGLLFAGATGWCGMAKLLAPMPWNRVNACGA